MLSLFDGDLLMNNPLKPVDTRLEVFINNGGTITIRRIDMENLKDEMIAIEPCHIDDMILALQAIQYELSI